MNLKDVYKYEIELKDGTIIINNNDFDSSSVVRVSFISTLFPRHDIMFTNYRFIKRFIRVFQKIDNSIKEVLHCVVTDKFRLYLSSSNGSILITDKDYDLYL